MLPDLRMAEDLQTEPGQVKSHSHHHAAFFGYAGLQSLPLLTEVAYCSLHETLTQPYHLLQSTKHSLPNTDELRSPGKLQELYNLSTMAVQNRGRTLTKVRDTNRAVCC